MKASRVKWRTCVARIGMVALAGQAAAAWADDAAPGGNARETVSTIDLAPAPGYVAHDPEFPGVDFTPTGSTAPARNPARALAAGDVTPLDLSPNPGGGTETLIELPLPPETPPLAALDPTPSVAAITSPRVAAPPTAMAPAPSESVAIAAPVTPPSSGLPAAVAEQPGAEPAAPLQAALAAFVADAAHARTHLDARPMRDSLRAFYASRLDTPIWTDASGITVRGRLLLERLERAGEDGINISAARLPVANISDASPARVATVEVALSAAAASYALQATGARVVPWSISSEVTARPAVVDAGAALATLAQAPDPGAALQNFNPPQRGYRDLRDELATLREGKPSAEARHVLRIGMTDPRVQLVRARFGLGARPDIKDTQTYDARVASAVAAFQRIHGIVPDGTLNPATSDALFGAQNTRRESMILANMEMWRWQPRDMGQRRVEVNVPDFTLRVLDGDDEIQRERVIVGKPDTPTPIFSNDIRYILVNPVWRVPDSIIKKEMAPKLASDPNYLTRRGFKVTKVGDRLVVEQPPGEGNALGHILFMFPNEHAVYLHDTPARGLFNTSRRAYSHGCVRVEDPTRLAELFMGGAARGWTAARVQSLVGANEKTVFLPKPIPIHIQYFTEFVDESGTPRGVEDVYGLTTKVAATLAQFRQY